MSADERTRVAVAAALSGLMGGEAPIRRAILPALLRGVRLKVADSLLDDVLSAGPFVEVEGGRWTLAESSDSVPRIADPPLVAPVAPRLEFGKPDLQAFLDIAPELLSLAISHLAKVDGSVNWSELSRRLDSGARVAISQTTLTSLSAEVSRRRAADTARHQRRIEQEIAERQAALQLALQSRTRGDESAVAQLRRELSDRDGENARLKAELETRRIEERRAVASESRVRAPAATDTHPEWRRTRGALCFQVAPPVTKGEMALARALESLEVGVVLTGLTLVHQRQEREVDALVVHPRGAFTIEQKDTVRKGEVAVVANRAVTVGGTPIEGGPLMRAQARKQSQLLASITKSDPDIRLGFVRPLLSFFGPVEIAPPTEDDLAGAEVLPTTPHGVAVLIDFLAVRSTAVVSAEAVTMLLERLNIEPPTPGALRRAGFVGG
jgi:hypothetical protein